MADWDLFCPDLRLVFGDFGFVIFLYAKFVITTSSQTSLRCFHNPLIATRDSAARMGRTRDLGLFGRTEGRVLPLISPSG